MQTTELISWIKRGKNRKKVFLCVEKQILPSEIVEQIFQRQGRKAIPDYAIVSRALGELKQEKLVKLTVSENVKTGRTYTLTSLGKKIKEAL